MAYENILSEAKEAVGDQQGSYVSGTREWSVASVNIAKGCNYGCLYCYAREMAMRFKRVDNMVDWRHMTIKRNLAAEKKKYEGRVMFPTTHDITPNFLQPSYEAIQNLLSADNEVLIVTKPNLYCTQVLCEALFPWSHAIMWRFTIGCLDGEKSKIWEPYAPPPVERLACLKHAMRRGFKTSVSMEPMLDPENVVKDFTELSYWASDTVWLGKMNHVRKRVVIRTMGPPDLGVLEEDVQALEKAQSDENIQAIYDKLNGFSKVRWKESIKKVVGLPLETEAGTDR